MWLKRAVLRSGRQPWPKLWVALRASRATELVDKYPSHVCAAWLGHTEAIANQHYRMVTSEHVQRATSEPTGSLPGQPKSNEELAQIPAHSPQFSANQGSSRSDKNPANPRIDEVCGVVKTHQVEDRGLEPLTFWLPARRSPN